MHGSNRPRIAVLVTISLGIALTCRADVLDFNTPPVAFQDAYGPGQSYMEDGFRLSTTNSPGDAGSIIRFNPSSAPGVLPNNGTVYFGATLSSHPWLDRQDGSLFTISQIDLAHYSQYAVVPNISFRGNKADGGSVSATFTLPTYFDGIFHTFQFGPDWTNLCSVDFTTDCFAWDNIVVSTVPEPGSGVLAAFGFIVLLASVSRRTIQHRP